MNTALPAVVLLCISMLPQPFSAQAVCTWAPVGGGVAGTIGTPPVVNSLGVFDDGSGPALYAGGLFASAGGIAAGGIARWDGIVWSGLGGLSLDGVSFGSGACFALAIWDDGTGPALYVGGNFSHAGNVQAYSIARWDGSSWSPLGVGAWRSCNPLAPCPFTSVRALAVFDDGTGSALYVAGEFDTVGSGAGIPANNIARWDGASWSAVGAGLPGYWYSGVSTLQVHDDGSGPALYAGGIFTPAGATSNVARWDGAVWTPLSGQPDPVFCLATLDIGSGPLLISGGSNNLKSWNGSAWSTIGALGVSSGIPSAQALAVFDDGSGAALHAMGSFDTVNGVIIANIARWNGNSWTPLGSGILPALQNFTLFDSALAVYDDGSGPGLYAGAEFTLAGGVSVSGIARWSCGATISLSATQPGGGPGSQVFVNNANLTPGHEYFNIFSLELCPAGPGTGPLGGLCSTNPGNLQFILGQLMLPLNTSLFHFTAQSSYVNWGPLSVPAVTLDAVCFDFTGNVLGSVSPAVRIAVQ